MAEAEVFRVLQVVSKEVWNALNEETQQKIAKDLLTEAVADNTDVAEVLLDTLTFETVDLHSQLFYEINGFPSDVAEKMGELTALRISVFAVRA